MANSLPTSSALREAGSGAESIAELLSRDPEHYQDLDLDRAIEALRAQRVRWQQADSMPKASRGRQQLATSTDLSMEDLGL